MSLRGWWRRERSLVSERLRHRPLLVSSLKAVGVVLLFLVVSFLLFSFFSAPGRVESLVASAGVLAPLVVVLLIVVEVVLAPVPGTAIMVASGFAFGPWLGALYSYLGNVLGSLLAFWLARRFGRSFVERLLSRDAVSRYDAFFHRFHRWLLLLYALPVVPVDILSFVSGLSGLRWRRFFLVVAVGFVPNTLALAFVGDSFRGLDAFSLVFYVVLFAVVFFLLAWLFRVFFVHRRKKAI
ncbi:VTT domain-containing protein [Candidatus Woesearchaeota archaeon]|nr:VTT domain-containing protein [Candidatus Woesearchaeota archaeon]